MKILDLFLLAINNLKRRKFRTVLTVLGVVIGTSSIVVMVSLGLGMSESMLQSFKNSGSLTKINISNYGGGASNSKKNPVQLTDDSIKSFESIPHVTGTSPSLEVNITAKIGAYEGNYSIKGVSQAYLSQLKIKEGSAPPSGASELTLVYGNTVGSSFHKVKNWEDSYIANPMKDTIFYVFPEKRPSNQNGVSGEQQESQSNKPQKKYILKAAAVMEGSAEDYSEESMYAYADIDTLKAFLKKIYKKDLVPDPKTGKNGKPLRYYVYDEAYVFVDDMNNVSEVQKTITDMGYSAYSNLEWLKQSQDSLNMVQMVLGGIGSVSLLVAAIGIMNTMMMSIFERTKEIGVMKVLGCDMGDIRNMFLTESALIGLFGGLVGIALSYGISYIINSLTGGGDSDFLMGFTNGGEGKLSLIPGWLAFFAIAFAMLVGMLSGYFPSVRAMKLSPLAAIRNE
jgi:ABC superfamily ATP binding cassette transporter protein